MRVLRICAAMVLLNTVVLCSIIGMNPAEMSKGLVAWAVVNGCVAFVTQCISLIGACEGE